MPVIDSHHRLHVAKRTSVPYDAEVEYLESTGTQWIDTGVYLRTPLKVECDYYLPARGAGQSIWGAYRQSTINIFQQNSNSSTRRETMLSYNGTNIVIYRYETPHFPYRTKAIVEATAGRQTFSTDFGSASGSNANGLTDTLNVTCGLFGYKRSSDQSIINLLPSGSRIYSWKCWINNELVFDGVPVRIGSTGCLYDKVSGTVLQNAGSGNFVLGEDKQPLITESQLYVPHIQKYTAKDYVQDGLVAMWDGIENAGWGQHNSSATTWVELTGQFPNVYVPVVDSNFSWQKDGLLNLTRSDNRLFFSGISRGATAWYKSIGIVGDTGTKLQYINNYTIEIVVNVPTTFTSGGGCGLKPVDTPADAFAVNNPWSSWRIIFGPANKWQNAGSYSGYVFGGTAGQTMTFSGIARPSGGGTLYRNATSILNNTTTGTIDFATNRYVSLLIPVGFTLKSCRFYARALTAEEIQVNNIIDRIRFNLP